MNYFIASDDTLMPKHEQIMVMHRACADVLRRRIEDRSNQKDPPPMTRDEAASRVFAAMSKNVPHNVAFVDSLVALGLLKTEEPLLPMQQAKKIAERFTHSGRDLMEMFHDFEAAGLTIVRKKDLK